MHNKSSVQKKSGFLFFLSSHRSEAALFFVWFIIQSLLLYQYGILTRLEAEKYIREANNLIHDGSVSTPNFWFYSTQIFLIAAAIKLKTGFFSVIIVQLLFNAWASFSFFKFASKISSRTTGVIITLVLICNFPFQTFNTSLQTESLFFSITILFSCYLLQINKLTLKNSILIFLLLVLISITRPSGLLFIPCTFIYLFYRFFSSFSFVIKICLLLAFMIFFLFFLNIALGSGGELDFMLPFRNECIICGVPALTHLREIKISENANSVFGILFYVTHNFDQFIRLSWLRSKAFWGMLRTYYSIGHNIYLGLYFFPLFIMLLFSLRSWFQNNKALLFYSLLIISATWGTVILTCADWHNRFFLSIAPYIYILVIPALQKITGKIKWNRD